MSIKTGTTVLLIIAVTTLSVCGCLGTKTPVSSAEVPPSLLLDYHRTGGFAGTDDHLIIFNNGAGLVITRSLTREFRMNEADTEKLVQLFRDAGFNTLREQYLSGPGSADLISYSITFGNKTVVTEDTAIPYPLQSVIHELDAIITARAYQDRVSGSLANIRT